MIVSAAAQQIVEVVEVVEIVEVHGISVVECGVMVVVKRYFAVAK